MHPAVGDSALHMSLLPNSASTSPVSANIPISLAMLAVSGRRNGLLRAPWAAAVSVPMQASRDVNGDMAVNEEVQAAGAARCQLQFCGLQSRAAAAGAVGQLQIAAASQVWAWLTAAHFRYSDRRLGFA